MVAFHRQAREGSQSPLPSDRPRQFSPPLNPLQFRVRIPTKSARKNLIILCFNNTSYCSSAGSPFDSCIFESRSLSLSLSLNYSVLTSSCLYIKRRVNVLIMSETSVSPATCHQIPALPLPRFLLMFPLKSRRLSWTFSLAALGIRCSLFLSLGG